ncbi:hypothetical protein [Actinoplanes sp. NPDC023714]|uniref:hypothetical protein n=1 Tax=Actinoplanes sp. NPDC023714 TaxID=3154322 RepID=UPI0033F01D10
MTIPRLAVPLGLLAVPRAVLHDLDLVHEGTAVNAALVFVPLLIWILVAVLRAGNPFLTLLAAGGVYGVCLAVVHNVFWSPAPGAGELLLRVAMTVSSLFTGVAVGALCGVIAWGLARVPRRRAP